MKDARILVAVLSTLCLAGACQTVRPDQEAVDEAVYIARYNESLRNGVLGPESYHPLADMAGAAQIVPLPAAASSSIDPAAIEASIDYARRTNSSSLLIWHKGALVSENYFGDHDRDSLLVSRSLAKPVAAVALGRAIAEGHIRSLDQPVADFFPEWAVDDRSMIQVRHLLDMRSGLLPQRLATGPDDIINRTYMHPRHDEIIIGSYPLVNMPGNRYEYANASAELIAPLIERATGVQYEDWVSEQVLRPIGAPGGTVWMNREGGTAHAGCCMMLPAETFLRIAILLLKDGYWEERPLLPEGFVTQMRTPTEQNPHAGMGVFVAGDYVEWRGAMNPESQLGRNWHSEPYEARDLFLFDGNGHQVAYIVPSADLVILRTGTRPENGMEWDNAHLPNLLLRGLPLADRLQLSPQPYRVTDQEKRVTAPDGRVIPFRLLEPEGCSECTTMIFSHGAFSTYDRYDALLIPLAQAGFRIVAPNHIDSEEHPERDAYDQAASMQKRIEDYAVLAAAFPAERTLAIGHSYGALIAQIAAGAQLDGMKDAPVPGAGQPPDAVIAVSPPGPVPGSISAAGWRQIGRPMLVVTGTTDILPGFIDDWRLHLVSYEASSHPHTYALVYEGMNHYMNGAYGRLTEETGGDLSVRTAAINHLLASIRMFVREIRQDSVPAKADWKALEGPLVQARMKEYE